MPAMNSKNREAGQGLIEYLLLTAVVLLSVVAFVTIYNGGMQQAENTLTNGVSGVAE